MTKKTLFPVFFICFYCMASAQQVKVINKNWSDWAVEQSCRKFEKESSKRSYRYTKGDVIVVFNNDISQRQINGFLDSLKLSQTSYHPVGSVILVYLKVKKGKENRWVKKLKKYSIVKCAYLNELHQMELKNESLKWEKNY